MHKELDKSVDKYFISSGFAFVHADSSTDVCAVEAVKLDDLDADAVRSGLSVRFLAAGCAAECGITCLAAHMAVANLTRWCHTSNPHFAG